MIIILNKENIIAPIHAILRNHEGNLVDSTVSAIAQTINGSDGIKKRMISLVKYHSEYPKIPRIAKAVKLWGTF